MLAGVAAGVAETLDADPSMVRIIWALLAILTGGLAFVVYIVMAIVVPVEEDEVGIASAGVPGVSPTTPGVSGTAGAPADPPGAAGAAGAGSSAGAAWTAPPSGSAEREARRAARRARRGDRAGTGRGTLIAGVFLIAIGGIFLLRELVPWFDFHLWWPGAVIGLGVVLIVASVRPNRPAE
jgi:phage shock protein C